MAARKKTARKKSVPSSRAVAKRAPSGLSVPSDVPDSWRERLQQYAEEDAATTAGSTGWPYIGTRGGVFRFNDESLEELPPMIILGVRYENCWFDGDYDPENPAPPDCFAIAKEQEDLAPPEDLGDKRQCMQTDPSSEACKGCWANAFGTADRGKGKACKNVRRIALLPADKVDAGYLSTVEGVMLRIPVTSVKDYSKYARKVNKGLGRPLFGLRTTLGIEDDDKDQFHITFDAADLVETEKGLVPMVINDADLLDVLETRRKEAEGYLEQFPNQGDDGDKPTRKGRSKRKGNGNARATRGPARKKSVRRKSARKSSTRKAGGAKY